MSKMRNRKQASGEVTRGIYQSGKAQRASAATRYAVSRTKRCRLDSATPRITVASSARQAHRPARGNVLRSAAAHQIVPQATASITPEHWIHRSVPSCADLQAPLVARFARAHVCINGNADCRLKWQVQLAHVQRQGCTARLLCKLFQKSSPLPATQNAPAPRLLQTPKR